MSKVPGKHAERKHEVRDGASVQLAMADMNARVEMIRALIPLGLEAVQDLLHDAVAQLAGPRYQHGPADRRYYRWGSERGSVYLADRRWRYRYPGCVTDMRTVRCGCPPTSDCVRRAAGTRS